MYLGFKKTNRYWLKECHVKLLITVYQNESLRSESLCMLGNVIDNYNDDDYVTDIL